MEKEKQEVLGEKVKRNEGLKRREVKKEGRRRGEDGKDV